MTGVLREQACGVAPCAAFRTPWPGQACQFSPHCPELVAVSTAHNYGIAGPGTQHVVTCGSAGWHNPPQKLDQVCGMETDDAILDCCWSEAKDNLVFVALGNGYVQAMHTDSGTVAASLVAHRTEVASVQSHIYNTNWLLTSGWDSTIRLWDVNRLMTIPAAPPPIREWVVLVSGGTVSGSAAQLPALPEPPHRRSQRGLGNNASNPSSSILYDAVWSPRSQHLFTSVDSNGGLRIWDVRRMAGQSTDVAWHRSNGGGGPTVVETLCVDWNKYQDNEVIVGTADGFVFVWDVRRTLHPTDAFQTHRLSVRRVQFSPFQRDLFASTSYDMTAVIWARRGASPGAISSPTGAAGMVEAGGAPTCGAGQFVNVLELDKHSEFVMGLDWSLFDQSLLCTTSWDCNTYIWSIR